MIRRIASLFRRASAEPADAFTASIKRWGYLHEKR